MNHAASAPSTTTAPAPTPTSATATQPPPPERQSWGRYPRVEHSAVLPISWEDAPPDLSRIDGSVLPYGLGRSYGDSCLNEGGVLLDTSALNRFIAFDPTTGRLRCEAGVTLAEILELAVPQGWFLATTPGTKFVTVGGAIANDVHGKNHHVAGTFGRGVRSFDLLRSNGERLHCSPDSNAEYFRATIGGLGLTGLILEAEIQLRPISGPYINAESLRFGSLDEFFEIAGDSNARFEFTMSWVDCLAGGRSLGRGQMLRGNFAWQPSIPGKRSLPRGLLRLPVNLPSQVLNGATVRAFNTALYWRQLPKLKRVTMHYDPFFYPLDSIHDWYRLYGRRGFLQHQCVLPHESARAALRAILEATARAGEGSFLVVLKEFGDLPSPGLLSFPRPGMTLALDFPMNGRSTLDLLDALDEIAISNGGAIYPAKDARMSPATFESSFPHWRELLPYIDPRFSSSFWRRVTGPLTQGATSCDS